MPVFRSALLRFADDGTALYEQDGLLAVGPDAQGRQRVLAAQKAVGAGRLHPFRAGKAAVRDNAGQEVIPAGQTLSDLQILQMNWLAEGVQGKLPR